MNEDTIFSIIFNESRGSDRRKRAKRRKKHKKEKTFRAAGDEREQEREDEQKEEEKEVIVPPSMRNKNNTSQLGNTTEEIDTIFEDDCFDGKSTTNCRANFVPQLRRERPIEKSPSKLTRCRSDVGSVIQPSSHTQYHMKNASKFSRDRMRFLHSRRRLQGDINSYNRLPTGLSPLIKHRLENYYPKISIESSSRALHAIQREADQMVVRPKARNEGNSKLQLVQETEHRDEDSSDISWHDDDISLEEEFSFSFESDSTEVPCSPWQCW